jgi:hypothetical protein
MFSRRRFLSIDLQPAAALSVIWLVFALFVPLQSGASDEKSTPPVAKSPPQPEHTQKPKPRITISKKTTYILEPLDQEGYVDYLAALNQMAGKGVTPENNAGTLLVRAFGASELKPADRARFYKLLGIDPLPERGQFLTDFGEFVKRKLGRAPTKKEFGEFDRSMGEPWSRGDFEVVAQWLKDNQQPLALVAAATRRPHCYLPLVEPAGSGLQGIPFWPTVQASRSAARLLTARAMLEIGEGKIADAEQDLLTCHRLARLYGRTPFLIPALVAIAVDSLACHGDARLMEFGHLPAEGALAYQQELRKLAPLPAMADVIDKSERFGFIDTVSLLARERLGPLAALCVPGSIAPKAIESAFSHRSAINWDDALVFANEQFDKVLAAARKPTVPERKRALEKVNEEMRRMGSDLRDPEKFNASFLGAVLRKDLGRQIGKLLTVLLLPALEAAFEAENRAQTREALDQVGFALAAFRADHGAYPDSLNELTHKYISQVPKDLYTEQPLHYRRQGAGFLLYSVGANGVDDGGRAYDSQPPGDDIGLRIAGGVRTKQ